MKNNLTYSFYKVKNKRLPNLEFWWALVLDTPEVLVEYTGFKSTELVQSYFKAKEKIAKKYHLGQEEACMLQVLSNRCERKTIVDDVKILGDEMLSPLVKYYLDGRIPIINKNGGFCFLDEEIEVLEKIEKNEMIWPDDDRKGICILRWPNGKHYYAKVGKQDVYDNKGNMKWSTAQQAEKWAKIFRSKL